MRRGLLLAVLILAGCADGGDGSDSADPQDSKAHTVAADREVVLEVAILNAGERSFETFRLENGRLAPTQRLRRPTVYSRAGSGDRQSIVFEEIYLRGADGSVQQLTRDRRADLAPQLMRDGRVAFVSCEFPDDDGVPSCSLDAVDPASGGRETLLDELGTVFHGELSPDERRFLFTPLDSQSGAPRGLFVRDLDGGDARLLADGEGGTWSPNGERIAFVSDRDENGRCLFHDCIGHAEELYVANADGSDEQRLTENTEDEGLPEWSGDGEWLIVGRIPDESADWDLYAIRADGECEVQLTDTERWETRAEWHGGGNGGLRC